MQFVEHTFGSGRVFEYLVKTVGAYEWTTGRRKRRNRKSTIEDYRKMQERGRNAQNGEEVFRNENVRESSDDKNIA